MNSITRPFSKTRRYAASVVATAALAVGCVACGTDTVDDVQPAAPAQVQVQAPAGKSFTQSADSADRYGHTQVQKQEPRGRFMGRPGPGF